MSKKQLVSHPEKSSDKLQRWRGFILVCISLIGIYVVKAIFDGATPPSVLMILLIISGCSVIGFLYACRVLLHQSFSTKEYATVVLWVALPVVFFVWTDMMSYSPVIPYIFHPNTSFYVGIGLVLAAAATYSFSFAVLWRERSRRVLHADVSWRESLIDKPYYRPGLAVTLTVVSYLVLFYQPGVPTDVSAERYTAIAQTVGLINLVFACTAVVLSIMSAFSVKGGWKIIFMISALVGLWVAAYQILGIALSGGIY